MHCRTLRRMGSFHLNFASRVGTRAEELRRRFEGDRAFGSYGGGLSDPSVDLVVITTPTVNHRDLAIRALRAGKHVIIEKPAFMAADDADAVALEARNAGRRVFVAENYAYKPITRHLREHVRDGSLGDIRFVSLNATKRQPAAGWRADAALAGGGALFEGGVHWVSFASNIGLDVESVDAWRAGSTGAPDESTLVVFRYTNGAVGTLAHSWELDAPLGGLRLSKVQGTLGAVTFESNGLWAFTTGKRTSMRVPAFRDPLGYRAMFVDFLTAIRDDAPVYFSLEMAQRDLQLLEQAAAAIAGKEAAAAPPAITQGARIGALR